MSIGVLAGLGAPPRTEAQGPQVATYTRVPARTVYPEVVDVRALIRRIGAVTGAPPLPRPIPSHRIDGRAGPAEPPEPGFFSSGFAARSPQPRATILTTFDTLPDEPGGEPPDNGLAVGPDHLVVAGNVRWGVWSKTGVRQFLIPFVTWYGNLDPTNFIFDPRVDYDVQSGRWILVSIGVQDFTDGPSTLQISVSRTSDPLGIWNKYVFDLTESQPSAWLDFPSVGYNNLGIFVCGNIFSFGANITFQHVTMHIFDKLKMMNGQPVTPVSLKDLRAGADRTFTIQPVTSHDSTNAQLMAEADFGVRNRLRFWRVTNPLSGSPTITFTSLPIAAWNTPPGMAQRGNTAVLDGSDGRTGNAVLRDNQVWVAHGVGDNSSGTNRGVARIYQINPAGAGSLLRTNILSDPQINFHYPSVDVDAFGSVLTGMSSASSQIFPSISVAVRRFDSSDFAPVQFMTQGQFSYTPKSGGNRWGDYSDTALDPDIPNVVWHQSELAASANTWKLHAGSVRTTEETLILTEPDGGEIAIQGQILPIRWQTAGFSQAPTIRIELSRDSGRTFPEVIAATTPDDGEFLWPAAPPTSNTARIRVTIVTDTRIRDSSDADFRIVDGSITVVEPNGGDLLFVGDRLAVTWNAIDFAVESPTVRIELSRDGGDSFEDLASSTPNDGMQEFRVAGPPTTEALVRITATDQPSFADTSDDVFEIREPSSLRLLSPNGTEVFAIGDPVDITWSAAGFSGNVMIEYSRDGGNQFDVLFPDTENDGGETLAISGPPTRFGRIRISSLLEPEVVDQSDGFFTVEAQSLTVISPPGGRRLLIGRTETVAWNSTGLSAQARVTVELSRDGGDTFEELAADTPNDGAFAFVVTGPATKTAVVRVALPANPEVRGVSESFSIAAPTLSVVNPNGRERWRIGNQELIQWSGSVVGTGTVEIRLSRDGGRRFETILRNTPNDGAEPYGVGGPSTRRAIVEIVWQPDTAVSDRSDAAFRILRLGRARPR